MAKLTMIQNSSEVIFSGNLDENSDFERIEIPAEKTIRFDLTELKSVNSVGIRLWVAWVTPLSDDVDIDFHHVPQSFILQANIVEGFLPPGSRVESFYVPIYSEERDAESEILLTVGKDVFYENNKPVLTVSLDDIQGESGWDFDFVPHSFLRFLSHVCGPEGRRSRT